MLLRVLRVRGRLLLDAVLITVLHDMDLYGIIHMGACVALRAKSWDLERLSEGCVDSPCVRWDWACAMRNESACIGGLTAP